MKKTALAAVFLLISALGQFVHAQKVELHYNFGKHLYKDDLANSPYLVTTLENFHIDPWGETFYFVDLSHRSTGIDAAYMEFARDLKFWQAPVYLHLEYNGGIVRDASLSNAFLAGASCKFADKENNWIKFAGMYRHQHKADYPHNMQVTASWEWRSWNRLFTLCGFADLFSAQYLTAERDIIFVAQPQAWLNLNQFVGVSDAFNLSIGTEVELSYNYMAADKFFARPTIGVKWTFR